MSTGSTFGAARGNASLQRGIAYAQQKQWQQAVNALTTALEEEPSSVPVRYHLAYCNAHIGKTLVSRRLLEDCLDTPRLDDAWRVRVLKLLARVSLQANDYQLAADSLETAYGITGAGGGPILNQLGQVFCKSGDFERGFDLFFKAMEG